MASNVTFSGLASGIDASRLAKAAADQIALPNSVHKKSIDALSKENDSLEQVRSLLLELNDSVDSLRTINGGAGLKEAVSSNVGVASVAADGSASTTSFEVSVSSIASSAKGSFNADFEAKDSFVISDPEQAGSVSFTVGAGASASSFNVNVTELTTAEDFVSEFNNKANGSASAQLVNLGTADSPSFRITFSTADTGTEGGSVAVTSANDALVNEALGGTTVQQATNAVFSISGVSGTFTRENNSINDAVSGISLKLEGVGTASITVKEDASAASKQVQKFVDAFNALQSFVAKEDAVKVVEGQNGRENIYGSLASTDVDDSALSAARAALSSASASNGTTFASLGVSTSRDGSLAFDEDKFKEGFDANPTAGREVIVSLADKLAGATGSLQEFTAFGKGIDSALKANRGEIDRLNKSMARIDRQAQSKEELILKQFTQLESLLARLNAQSNYLSQILGASF